MLVGPYLSLCFPESYYCILKVSRLITDFQ